MAFSFYFTIEFLLPASNINHRSDNNGYWLPPKAKGHNEKLIHQGQVLTRTFYYNSARQPTVRVAVLPPKPDRTSFGAYSIYYCEGRIHGIPYDATLSNVHNGRDVEHDNDTDSDSSDSDGGGAKRYPADWQEIRFHDVPEVANQYPKLSYVAAGAQHRTLRAQRSDQLWARYLLPNRYQRQTMDKKNGGMVGPLSLLIGLTAMALPPGRWVELLPQILVTPHNGVGPWRWPDAIAGQIARGSIWRDQRGVVVTIYLDPENQRGSSPQALQAYQYGMYGPIFA